MNRESKGRSEGIIKYKKQIFVYLIATDSNQIRKKFDWHKGLLVRSEPIWLNSPEPKYEILFKSNETTFSHLLNYYSIWNQSESSEQETE